MISNLFSSLKNLIYLKIEKTAIEFIHPNALSHLVQLQTLILANNTIKKFDLDLINNQKCLRILDAFESTWLKQFDFNLLDRFPDLRVLSFRLHPENEESNYKYLSLKDKYM